MAREKGLFQFSGNFEVTKAAPLDTRTVVDTLAELTVSDTWKVDGKVWLYDGIVVAVKENKGLYMLTGMAADPTAYSSLDNWNRIDASAAHIDLVTNVTTADDTKALAASQGKVLDEKITALKTSLSSVYNYKCSVDTYEELPESPQIGDVYNVVGAHGNVPAGTNYAWNGEAWDALGGAVDLSNYVTKAELQVEKEGLQTEFGSKIAGVETKADANAADLVVIKGDDTVDGSIKNALKLAKEYTDDQGTKYVEKVEGSSLITAEKLELIDTNASNISNLSAASQSNSAAIAKLNGTGEGSVSYTATTIINKALDWKEIN